MTKTPIPQTLCVVDGKPIPDKRAINRSVTCSELCSKELRKIRRLISSGRQCTQCHAPSSPEERKLFAQWRRERGELAAAGRPKKEQNGDV
jgi:predicted nucleic acid-binding Zn ribbon protein